MADAIVAALAVALAVIAGARPAIRAAAHFRRTSAHIDQIIADTLGTPGHPGPHRLRNAIRDQQQKGEQ
jgi:hypothetical protein